MRWMMTFLTTYQILDAIERLEHCSDFGSLTLDDWLNQQGNKQKYTIVPETAIYIV